VGGGSEGGGGKQLELQSLNQYVGGCGGENRRKAPVRSEQCRSGPRWWQAPTLNTTWTAIYHGGAAALPWVTVHYHYTYQRRCGIRPVVGTRCQPFWPLAATRYPGTSTTRSQGWSTQPQSGLWCTRTRRGICSHEHNTAPWPSVGPEHRLNFKQKHTTVTTIASTPRTP
jgi:hypothetical protein